jgi:hypothetical protein
MANNPATSEPVGQDSLLLRATSLSFLQCSVRFMEYFFLHDDRATEVQKTGEKELYSLPGEADLAGSSLPVRFSQDAARTPWKALPSQSPM